MFIDRENKWVRRDKLVKDDGRGSTGVNGDQTIGTAETWKDVRRLQDQGRRRSDSYAGQVRSVLHLGGATGTKAGHTYAKSSAMNPITAISSTLCLTVKRNSRLSSADVMPVAATATAML